MCSTCGCMRPKDKHGEKTLAAANKKYAKTKKAKAKKQAAIALAKKGK